LSFRVELPLADGAGVGLGVEVRGMVDAFGVGVASIVELRLASGVGVGSGVEVQGMVDASGVGVASIVELRLASGVGVGLGVEVRGMQVGARETSAPFVRQFIVSKRPRPNLLNEKLSK
jgi:hypothetical protein